MSERLLRCPATWRAAFAATRCLFSLPQQTPSTRLSRSSYHFNQLFELLARVLYFNMTSLQIHTLRFRSISFEGALRIGHKLFACAFKWQCPYTFIALLKFRTLPTPVIQMPSSSKYLPYFFINKAEQRAVCGACEKPIKCTGRNTKGLQEHLRRLHPELYIMANAHKDECVPEYVLSHKDVGNLRLYLVKWENWPVSDAT